jgi:hypothetical protein
MACEKLEDLINTQKQTHAEAVHIVVVLPENRPQLAHGEQLSSK